MRLCANENLPGDCVLRLRQDGHDVLWIREVAPGSSDADVLARAREEDRLLITFDKDFGELVFRHGAKASHGIVLFRIAQPSAMAVAARVAAILASRNDWPGNFSVVEESAVRMRPLPSAQ
jgi:predicted nuclease of predicted toxin-antitoxin system